MDKTTFITHGYFPICNVGSMLVMIDSRGDGVRYKFASDTVDEEDTEAEILYDTEGEEARAYFLHRDERYYLDECMRTSN
jgi:hypothetical protein